MSNDATILIDPRLCLGTSMIIEATAPPNGTWLITVKDDTVNFSGGHDWYLYDSLIFRLGSPLIIRLRNGQTFKFPLTVSYLYDPVGTS